MIYSYDLEQQLISGLLKHPDFYPEIAPVISAEDFFSENSSVNKTLFSLLKHGFDNGEVLDYVVLSERIKSLGISFEDNINIADYIKSLSLRKINKDGLLTVVKELKKLSIRRELFYASVSLSKQIKGLDSEKSYSEIISLVDSTLNEKINLYNNGDQDPENIFEDMPLIIEDLGENPPDNAGALGPHPRVNELYGSLLRPGNITVIVARSGVGKTTFTLDFTTKASVSSGIPVLHLDNGEMSKEELVMRQCAALSGVSVSLLESGAWRKNKEAVNKVRAVWPKIKNYKFYYYNVGGMGVDEMISIIKRFYYSKVGRGNLMFLSFDYIKTTFEKSNNKNEWQVVGEMVDKFKKLIQSEILSDGKPLISLITSVQSNRSGITTNRSADSIVDDESIVSLSDRITQFSSHLFSLRPKTLDELDSEGDFGTHKLTCLKYRHLGENIHRATQPVRMEDGSLKRNCIHVKIDNFDVVEIGDHQDMIESRSGLTATADQLESVLETPDLESL
jgi:replicative DNA helicase